MVRVKQNIIYDNFKTKNNGNRRGCSRNNALSFLYQNKLIVTKNLHYSSKKRWGVLRSEKHYFISLLFPTWSEEVNIFLVILSNKNLVTTIASIERYDGQITTRISKVLDNIIILGNRKFEVTGGAIERAIANT